MLVKTPMATSDACVGRLKKKVHARRSASMQAVLCLMFGGVLILSPFSQAQYPDGAIETMVEKSLAEKLRESVEQAVVTKWKRV